MVVDSSPAGPTNFPGRFLLKNGTLVIALAGETVCALFILQKSERTPKNV